MKRSIFICILLSNCLLAVAQEKTVYGAIKDSGTLYPIAFVTVLSSQAGTSTNIEGFFSINVSVDDSIQLSHVNYRTKTLLLQDVGDSLVIYLQPKNVLLEEIVIRGLPAEEKLKNEILASRIRLSREETNATINIVNSHLLFLSGYRPALDSYENFQLYIAGPQDATFFSTNPSRGLSQVFKNISWKSTMYKRNK